MERTPPDRPRGKPVSGNRLSVLMHDLYRLVGSPRDGESDVALLTSFVREQDEQAFAVLMRRYGPLVWRTCRRMADHEQNAEDVYQATFMLLARKAASIRKSGSLGSWLFGVAHRLALRAKADATRRRLHELRALPPASKDQTADVTWRELRAVLDEELARLPDKYRAPLLLCYFEGLTQEEAANRLGWTKRAVKDRLQRGRDRLCARLTRRGLTLSAALTGSMLTSSALSAPVPAGLAASTLQTAILFGLREPLAGAASANALALAKGTLKAMFLTKLATVAVGLFAVAALGGAGLVVSNAGRDGSPRAAAPIPRDAPPVPQATAPVPQAEKPILDRWGDPLPAGAVLRLGTVRFRTESGGLASKLGFLPDNKTVVSVGEWNTVLFWEAGSGKLLREIGTGELSIRDFALSNDGKLFAAAGLLTADANGNTTGAIGIWGIFSGKQVRTWPRTAKEVNSLSMAFTPDGKLLVSLAGNGVLRVEEVATGTEILRHQFPPDGAGGTVALSPNGSMMAVASGLNTHKLYLWKWRAAEEPRELEAPRGNGHRMGFSPDGKTLAEAGQHDVIRVWDVASGRLLQKLQSPAKDRNDLFSSVLFSPDGKTLIASAHSNTAGAVHIWDAATWKPLSRYDQFDQPALGLSVSADSRLLAGISKSGVRVWDILSGEELSANDEAHRGNIIPYAAKSETSSNS
jgi:RNA polymerase sigma factor (sigma-70 family)